MATFHFVSVVVSIPKLWTDMEPFRGATKYFSEISLIDIGDDCGPVYLCNASRRIPNSILS